MTVQSRWSRSPNQEHEALLGWRWRTPTSGVWTLEVFSQRNRCASCVWIRRRHSVAKQPYCGECKADHDAAKADAQRNGYGDNAAYPDRVYLLVEEYVNWSSHAELQCCSSSHGRQLAGDPQWEDSAKVCRNTPYARSGVLACGRSHVPSLGCAPGRCFIFQTSLAKVFSRCLWAGLPLKWRHRSVSALCGRGPFRPRLGFGCSSWEHPLHTHTHT